MHMSHVDDTQLLSEVQKHILYQIEEAKLGFAIQLKRAMDRERVTPSELASRLGVSRPMVSKLLGGEANVTLETMVKATNCLGSKLHVNISSMQCTTRYFEVTSSAGSVSAAAFSNASETTGDAAKTA
jgi:plasmid maintenance system antidote protein VapI